MDTGNRPVSETFRRSVTTALLAIYFSIAPSEVPRWRSEAVNRSEVVLLLGGPGLAILPHR